MVADRETFVQRDLTRLKTTKYLMTKLTQQHRFENYITFVGFQCQIYSKKIKLNK